MPHLDKMKPACAQIILKQESGEKEEVASLMLFYVFGHGPHERFGFQLYTGIFFSLTALKKQNPTQTLQQHQRNSKRFAVKQLFNNAIFHMQAQVKFLTY